MRDVIRRGAAVLAAVALTAGGLSSLPAAASGHHPGRSLVVATDRGLIRGARSDQVERFLGVRYAAAPVGDLRWRAPVQPSTWRGVADASTFGNPCPVLPSSNGPRSETEDCLLVNVWRPAGTRVRDRLPVHVFIHGGGLINGSGAQNDESDLVRRTGVIGVSLNYRLGVFGFLRTPQLAAESADAGNYGFLDQQAALRWVQRNIAAFGGDPDEVTIDGESAGAWSVCGHLTSPGSRGLFDRAMLQSGSCSSQTTARAEQRGAAYAAATPCTDGSPTCLRRLSAGAVLDAGEQYGATSAARFVAGTPSFPEAPAAAVAAGRFRHVPVLIGANRDEGRTFAAGFIGADRAAYESFVDATFGNRADDVRARYPWPADADRFTAAYLIGAIQTDAGLIAGIGGCPNLQLTRKFARWTPTYAYEFAHRTGPGLAPIPGYVWGAGHAAELAYVWPSFDNGRPIASTFDRAERQLAREMTDRWGAFASRGRPADPGAARWPRYHGSGWILSLRAGGRSTPVSTERYRSEHRCGFWATVPTIDLTA